MLSKSQFNRRLHRASDLFMHLFQGLTLFFKAQEEEAENGFLIDSFPVKVCDNVRSDQCRMYPTEAT